MASADLNRRPPPSSPLPVKGVPGQLWTHIETLHLIDAYEERWLALNRGHLRAPQWDAVAADVAARCAADPSFPPFAKSSVQCRHKIEKLRKRYRADRARPLRSVWPYFDRMGRLERGSGHQKDDEVDNENRCGDGIVRVESIRVPGTVNFGNGESFARQEGLDLGKGDIFTAEGLDLGKFKNFTKVELSSQKDEIFTRAGLNLGKFVNVMGEGLNLGKGGNFAREGLNLGKGVIFTGEELDSLKNDVFKRVELKPQIGNIFMREELDSRKEDAFMREDLNLQKGKIFMREDLNLQKGNIFTREEQNSQKGMIFTREELNSRRGEFFNREDQNSQKRKVFMREQEEEEEVEGEEGGMVSRLAAVAWRLGDGMMRLEDRRMEMMRQLERDWMEMESKRLKMVMESQRCLIEMIAGNFSRTDNRAKRSHREEFVQLQGKDHS